MFEADPVTTGIAFSPAKFSAFNGSYSAIPAGFAFHRMEANCIFAKLLSLTPC